MISEVEDAVLDKVSVTLPNLLRETGSLGGTWTLNTMRRALQFAPGVYVSFVGGPATDDNEVRVGARFDVYVVIKEPQEIGRRRGDKRTIGAYEIIERLVPALHGLVIDGIGTLILKDVTNLFKETLFDLGGSVYALSFAIPLGFDVQDPADIGEFLLFHSDLDVSLDSDVYVRAAVASLTIAGGVITAVVLDDGGKGYTKAPEILLYGPGAGAVLQAVISGGIVTSVTVSNGGSGYSEKTKIGFTYPPGGQVDARDDVILEGP